MRCILRSACVWTSTVICLSGVSDAGFVTYAGDGAAWFQNVSNHDTITFTEFPHDTLIVDQYAHLGVTFTDNDGNWTIATAPLTYPQDGFGLNGNVIVELTFATPTWAFASHFPGTAFFKFYAEDELLFASPMMGGGGVNFFAGFTTDMPFDRLVIHGLPPNPFGVPDKVAIDNFYFAAIPSPAGLLLFGLAGLRGRSRRRR